MRRSVSGSIALLLAIMLLAGCGNTQPSGPPPALAFPTSTGAGSSPAGGKTLQIFHFQGPVAALAWSPDGKELVTAANGSRSAIVQVWDVQTGQATLSLGEQLGSACCLAWSPDGGHIVAGGRASDLDQSSAQIWDASNGNSPLAFVEEGDNEIEQVLALAWSLDGARIATAIEVSPVPSASNPNPQPSTEIVQVWEAATGKLLLTYSGHTGRVNALSWSPDSQEIASASADKTVQVWNATTGALVFTYRGHTMPILAIAWSPTGRAIASAGSEPGVQVWEPTTGHVFLHYQGHAGNVGALAWSPDGNRLVSGSQSAGGILEDHPIQVWDAFTGRHPFYYTGQSESVTALAWSPDGKEIASAGGETAQIWQAPAES